MRFTMAAILFKFQTIFQNFFILVRKIVGMLASGAFQFNHVVLRHIQKINYLSRDQNYLAAPWAGKDSNLRRLSQQIYSLSPLTAREPALNCKLIRAASGA